jgi:hypothetical protein
MVEYEVGAGSEIKETINQAIVVADREDDVCQFEFNGLKVQVSRDSNPDLIYRDWKRSMYDDDIKVIGPHPGLLSDEQILRDRELVEASERESQRRSEEYKLQAQAAKDAVDGKIRDIEVQWSHPEIWREYEEKNQDFYGKGILDYAERWAKLMQKYMNDPNWVVSVENFAKMAAETSHEADVGGITTGFMYNCAVNCLVRCWVAGELLRRWHNKESQFGTEGDEANDNGGILNTAMLNIGL